MFGEERGSGHAALRAERETGDVTGLESLESALVFGTGCETDWVRVYMKLGDCAARCVSYEFEEAPAGQTAGEGLVELWSVVGSGYVWGALSGVESEVGLEFWSGVYSAVGLGPWSVKDSVLVLKSLPGVEFDFGLGS